MREGRVFAPFFVFVGESFKDKDRNKDNEKVKVKDK
jgi:hypothetical protein